MSLFTPDDITALADAVATLTKHAVGLQYHYDPGDGRRYVGNTMSWSGEFAAERAAAYFAHAAHDWASREQSTSRPVLPAVITKALAVLEAIEAADVNATDSDKLRAELVREAADDGAALAEGRWTARARANGRR
jgi:hypothetical protein